MNKIPEKLDALHSGEEMLRAKSLDAICADEDMSIHVSVVEKGMDVLNLFSATSPDNEDEDEKAIRLLGMRLFNGCAASFQLTTSGYYQAAVMLQRDLLETVFLLGFFRHEPKKVKTWRTADTKTRKNQFSAFNIRCALDERDGFTEKKRLAEYELLCELASHPTHFGLRMLAPKGHPHHCGPFFDQHTLKAVVEHLAKLTLQAGQAFHVFFDARTKEENVAKLVFMESCGEWLELYRGLPFDRKPVDELKNLIAQVYPENIEAG